jgi:hypothetical protein
VRVDIKKLGDIPAGRGPHLTGRHT